MAVVTKTFSFSSDAEGLVDQGNTLTGSWDSGDGSPSSGCVKVTGTSAGYDGGEMATSGTTFASWGVPGGATINGIEIISAKIKSSDVSQYHFFDFTMASSPTWGATLGSPSAVSANAWESVTGTGGYVDLTAYSLTSASACIAALTAYNEYVGVVTMRIDTVVVDITYTAGGGGGGLSIPVAMNSYRQRRV